MIKSCYIHIPFCSNICSYCDFCKFFYDEDTLNLYLLALDKEIKANYKQDELDTIYIGGGTPSVLKMGQLEKLFEIVDNLMVSNNFEFTFECNVNDLTEEKLTFLKKHRVNRLSIGVESFQEENLSFLERSIDINKIIENVNLAKTYFANINLDLMYAIPGEDITDLKSDLELFLSLDVSHISTYSLIIEDNTKLKVKKTDSIDEDTDRIMYDMIHNTLTANGYIHYEISNFGKEGNFSRHNLTYWRNHMYYGFGLGASGYVDGVRYTNTRNIKKYLADNYIDISESVDTFSDASNYAILGLRTIYGVDNMEFMNKFGKDFIEYFNAYDLIDDNVILKKDNRYYLSYKYWYIQNEILIKFI